MITDEKINDIESTYRLEAALRELVDAHFAYGLGNEPRETRAWAAARAALAGDDK